MTFLGPFLINETRSFIPRRDIGFDTIKDFIMNGDGNFMFQIVMSYVSYLQTLLFKYCKPTFNFLAS